MKTATQHLTVFMVRTDGVAASASAVFLRAPRFTARDIMSMHLPLKRHARRDHPYVVRGRAGEPALRPRPVDTPAATILVLCVAAQQACLFCGTRHQPQDTSM